jgi:hypothetical protein
MKKNFIKLFGIIASVVVIGSYFASCATTTTTDYPVLNYTYPDSGSSNNAPPAVVKDYQPLGIIFVKASEAIDSNGNHTGSKITYEMLMLEAQKLEADDVMNVRIDVNQVDETIENDMGFSVTKTTYNYTATALAIKYTTAIVVENGTNNLQSIGNMQKGIGNTQDMGNTVVETDAATATKSTGTVDWRNRRVYLGGWGGLGSWYERAKSGAMAGMKLELSLAKYFSIDFDVGAAMGNTGLGAVTPSIDIFAHIPFRSNSGFDIGILGGIFGGDPDYVGAAGGGSLGFKMGNGILFLEAFYMKSFKDDQVYWSNGPHGSGYYKYDTNGVNARVGYKVGLGKR